jgi:hypothetical protein
MEDVGLDITSHSVKPDLIKIIKQFVKGTV